jgi:hypothetical protein
MDSREGIDAARHLRNLSDLLFLSMIVLESASQGIDKAVPKGFVPTESLLLQRSSREQLNPKNGGNRVNPRVDARHSEERVSVLC